MECMLTPQYYQPWGFSRKLNCWLFCFYFYHWILWIWTNDFWRGGLMWLKLRLVSWRMIRRVFYFKIQRAKFPT
jgi:hypothetical protein